MSLAEMLVEEGGDLFEHFFGSDVVSSRMQWAKPSCAIRGAFSPEVKQVRHKHRARTS
jgi:hypothetical protein